MISDFLFFWGFSLFCCGREVEGGGEVVGGGGGLEVGWWWCD